MTETIIDLKTLANSALDCLDGRTWSELTLAQICQGAGVKLVALSPNIDKAKIGYEVPSLFDQAMFETAPHADDTLKDKLFDTLMSRYEAMEPKKNAVTAYLRFANSSPIARIKLAEARSKTAKMCLSQIEQDHSTDLPLPVKTKLLALTIRKADLAWLDKSDTVYSSTMVALQEGVDSFTARVEKWGKRKNHQQYSSDLDTEILRPQDITPSSKTASA